METVFRYWQLIRLDSAGHCQVQVLPHIQIWLTETFPEIVGDANSPDRPLQTQLLQLARSQAPTASLAQLSLRCYISHQIRFVCLQLAQQFGNTYGFTAPDLFPLVLDDGGKPTPGYRPLSLEILDTYDPAKAQLSTWTTRLVKNHSDLDRALLARGLYRASDWSILNDTRLEQLPRILGQYHLCGEAEVETARQLLQSYHQVYRQDRIRQRQAGKGGKCQPPTPDQLQRIAPQRSPKAVLADLKALAAQLRQYRIHARGGNPTAYRSDGVDWEALPDDQATSPLEDNPEAGAEQFLTQYRHALHQCLAAALGQVIEAHRVRLQKRQPPRDRAYIQGLHLFHCQGLAMGKLAPHIGLSTQVQVNRLLQLKRLRADTRHRLIPELLARVQAEALQYISADRLTQLDRTLETLLTERVDQLMDAAAKEAQIPQGRSAKSLFAHQLCQTLHQFMTG